VNHDLSSKNGFYLTIVLLLHYVDIMIWWGSSSLCYHM